MSRIALLLVTAAALGLPLSAQSQQPVFRGGVDIVHFDVSVLDRSRRPVRGLTQADFTVLEDGRPQPISVFAAVDVPADAPPAEPAAWVRTASIDVRTNAIARAPEGRLFVLLIDDGLMPNDPMTIANAKHISRLAIERLGPADQMAVVFSVGSRGSQNFTSDRGALLAAVETLQQGYASHLFGWDTALFDPVANRWKLTGDTDTLYHMGSLRTLEGVADVLIGAPQRRKAIVYVGPGVTVDPSSVAQPELAGKDTQMGMRESYASVFNRLPEIYRRLQRANVTIYPVDPTGLAGFEAWIAQRAAGLRATAQAITPMGWLENWFNPSRPPMAGDIARRVSTLTMDFLQAAAANTGGIATVNTNDFTAGVARIFDENASYYVLGFAPAARRPGSLHRLEVRVNRDDVRVRARSGYNTGDVAPDEKDGAASDRSIERTRALGSALAGPVPAGDLALRASAAAFAVPGSEKAAVVITIGVLDAGGADRGEQQFELQARAFSPEGAERGSIRQSGKIALRQATARGDAALDLLARIDLLPGRHELRLATLLDPANLAGSVFVDVDVPEFYKAELSMSGVVLETMPAGRAGPLSVLDSLVPVVPTTRREFGAHDSVSAFARVYQGGDGALASATLQITVQDGHDRIVYNYRHPLQVSRFDLRTRHADVRFALPFAAMQPGSHLLTFEARLGERTARRQVRFAFK